MVDATDFSAVVQAQQQGGANTWTPILLPAPAIISGQQPVETEINIQPCDCIWLPATYDPSYGINVAQQQGKIGPPMDEQTGQYPWAVNVQDKYSLGKFEAGVPFITSQAPIWGLRFNSPNNPWLLWTLARCMDVTQWGDDGSGDPVGQQLVGIGGGMRCLTGPISRLWARLYRAASVSGVNDTRVNNTYLISSLGYNQVTPETSQAYDDTPNSIIGVNSVLTQPAPLSTAGTHGGGYVTPQINSANRKYLAGTSS